MIQRADPFPDGSDSTLAEPVARQLPLRLPPAAGRRFENFEAMPANAELVDAVRRAAQGPESERLLIVGDAGCGKTHLLEAAVATASAAGDAVAFAPMRVLRGEEVDSVRGLARAGLVCIDDIDAVAGDPRWEEALLALLEEATARRSRVIASAAATPPRIPFTLADLRSRLSAATLYRLRELEDAGRARALRRHARARGIDIPQEVVGYVLTRCRRDMPSLVALLDRLDYHSMVHQRRLTIPFVRELIETGADPAPSARPPPVES